MSTARHQAAADEGDVGQRIEAGNSPMVSTRNTAPSIGSPLHKERLQECEADCSTSPQLLKTLWMPRRKNHHGFRMIGQNVAKCREQRAFLRMPSSVLPQTRTGPAPARVGTLIASCDDRRRRRRRHIEFQVAATWTRFGSAPISIRRRPSSSVCARKRSTLRSRFLGAAPAALVAGKRAVGDAAVDDGDARADWCARRRKFGQNSVSAMTTVGAAERDDKAATAKAKSKGK